MSTSLFTDPIEVYNKVSKALPGEIINKNDIFEWCIDAEINYIKDGDLLAKFVDIPIEINSNSRLGALPCNIIRILEVYEDSTPIEYQLTASNHIKVNSNTTKVYIHYLGVWVDEDGVPRIHTGHVNALVTFCITKILEPKVLMLKYPEGMIRKYETKFSNQITAIKQSAQYKDVNHYDKINIIRYNMIKKVGRNRLFKNIFG